MNGMRLLPLGVGDAFSALNYSTCLALEAEGAWLLIDCPHPIRKMLREASISAGVVLGIEQVRAVVLTHTGGPLADQQIDASCVAGRHFPQSHPSGVSLRALICVARC